MRPAGSSACPTLSGSTEVSRLGTATDLQVPLSELVLVDQHEAQGWRVRQDERLDRLFEERCDWVRTYGRAGQLAVDAGDESLTYDELDARSNQLARYLRLHGASGGDRIALLFDRPTDSYVAVLAVLKIGATYVPLDPGAPSDRLAAIVDDSRARIVLSTSDVAARAPRIELLTARGAELVHLDRAAPLIAEQDGRRLFDAERGNRDGQLAYITYAADGDGRTPAWRSTTAASATSSRSPPRCTASGRGTACTRAGSIASTSRSRRSGCPGPSARRWCRGPPARALRGGALHAFLGARRVTALCCAPTLLATVATTCPTCGSCWCPGRPAQPSWSPAGTGPAGGSSASTARPRRRCPPPGPSCTRTGRSRSAIPLPTYSTVVLDADDPYRALPHGEIGEIGIAGIGLACGYLDRDDLTEQAFVPDFLGIPANPSGRIYRTGDLGRVTADGEIEYHGRVGRPDRPRLHRTELEEIESALRSDSGNAVAQIPGLRRVDGRPRPGRAPSAACRTRPSRRSRPCAATGVEGDLAAVLAEVLEVATVPVEGNVFDDLGADSMVMARFCARLRKRDDLPTVSMKDVYAHPTLRSLAVAFAPRPRAPAASSPTTPVRRRRWPRCASPRCCEVLGVASVPVEGNFFDDLGADSMVMARFCARLRKRDDLPTVSMKDVYANPTIAEPGRGVRSRGPRRSDGARRSGAPVAPRRRSRRLRWRQPVQTALAAVLAEVLGSSRCRSTATSSTTWAPTRW